MSVSRCENDPTICDPRRREILHSQASAAVYEALIARQHEDVHENGSQLRGKVYIVGAGPGHLNC